MTNGALPETKWSGLPALHSGPTLIGKTRRNSRKKRKKMRTTAINDINELCDFVRETAFAIIVIIAMAIWRRSTRMRWLIA